MPGGGPEVLVKTLIFLVSNFFGRSGVNTVRLGNTHPIIRIVHKPSSQHAPAPVRQGKLHGEFAPVQVIPSSPVRLIGQGGFHTTQKIEINLVTYRQISAFYRVLRS